MKITVDEQEIECEVISFQDFYAEEDKIFKKGLSMEEEMELIKNHEQNHLIIKIT